jgi:hypothetical protein
MCCTRELVGYVEQPPLSLVVGPAYLVMRVTQGEISGNRCFSIWRHLNMLLLEPDRGETQALFT